MPTDKVITQTGQPRSEPSQSPHRQHYRTASAQRVVKETRNARSQYSNSEDDGTSQHRINQYWIRDEIGRGSFGAVHLAVDQYGQEYAAKEFSKSRLRRRAKSNLLRRPRQQPSPQDNTGAGPAAALNTTPQFQASEDEAASFDLIKEEIAIMKKLHHPNLVSLIEVLDDPEEDSLYMMLEMCKKGVVMKVEVDQDADPYEDNECRTWFRDLILAIEYLHAQGVVHRDIKPDNCLLTEDDTLKVVDFGVSEMFEKTAEMKIAKSAGSPAFMAPELCTIKHGDVFGKPADIWSMGVTLYCLRFGRVPFKQTAVLDLYRAICHDDVEVPEDCGPELKDLMSQLLQKDPEKRIKMDQLRVHSWVTKNGADPLLSAKENCANLVSLPTEEEKNTAITGNMGRIMAVMKAVNKFKALIARKRPDLIEGMFGRASQLVQPPLSISKAKDDTKALFGWSHRDKQTLSRPQQQSNASSDRRTNDYQKSHQGECSASTEYCDKRETPAMLSTSSTASPTTPNLPQSKGSGAHEGEPQLPSRGDCQGHKGHAHDPLEDHLYLRIGASAPLEVEDNASEDSVFVLSESPSAVDGDIYSKAYHSEVDRIRQTRGEDTIVYLTRRVEGMHDRENSEVQQEPKKKLANLLKKATS